MEIKSQYGLPELEEMAALGLENYGADNDISKSSFLEWQYLKNPAGKARVSLSYDGGRLTGEIAQLPLEYRIGKKNSLVSNFINALINKRDRDISVFYALNKNSFGQCGNMPFAFSLPNPNSYPLYKKLFKCETVCGIPLLIIPMRPRALAKKMIGKTLGSFVPPIVYKGLFCKRAEIKEIKSADELRPLAEFFDRNKDRYNISLLKTREFLSWRYFEGPRDYKILTALENGEIRAAAVIRTVDVSGIRNGMLVDFVAEGSIGTGLLKEVKKRFNTDKCELCGCLMLPHTDEYKYLKRAGFIVCPEKFLPQPFLLSIKIFDGQNRDFYIKPENWFITMGDYDAV